MLSGQRASHTNDILVVDDDHDVAESIELALRRRGYQVSVAHSGVEALKLLGLGSMLRVIGHTARYAIRLAGKHRDNGTRKT